MLLFDQVEPQTVAWFRIIGASIALLVVSRGWRSGWTRPQLISVAVFGITTALMNICFYLAIDRIDLGKGVTIEFIGPITVAAIATRSIRNGVALAFAIVGVVVLGGVEVADNLDGLFFILLASALWAGYIVLGSRVAQVDRGVAGLGLGLCIGAIVDHSDRRSVEWPGLALPHTSRGLSPRGCVLERDWVRHRPVHHASHSDPSLFTAVGPPARYRISDRLDRPRPTAVRARHHRHRVGAGGRRCPRARRDRTRRAGRPHRPGLTSGVTIQT